MFMSVATDQYLRAPFPYFGGKSRVAHIVWERFGVVPNYVEPFFGSGAVLLGRPHAPGTETVNDKDKFLANFWRALQADPESVAAYADWPVNETDLHARHMWLVTTGRERIADLESDPELFDAKVAGWWVWGLCSWIAGGWCSGRGPWQVVDGVMAKGDGDPGQGVKRQLPHLGSAGNGVHRKRPHLGNAGRGIFDDLARRLRRVRVCAGDWSRVVGPSVTENHGITGVFLDPPYADTAGRADEIYAIDDLTVAHDVRAWAISNGDNPLLRIALCGYEGEHEMPDSWETVAWKTHGGYGGQSSDGAGRENSKRERIWFSPHCIKPERERTLFDFMSVRQDREGEHEHAVAENRDSHQRV